MRYPATEKLEIIRLVEQSHLSARRTLAQLGIPKTTFYRWYDLFLTHGPEGLEDGTGGSPRVWNRIADEVRGQIVEMALEHTELSPRELAVKFCDEKSYFVSEASVYRLLKERNLITSPAYVVMKAAEEYHDKTTAPNQMWQTDFTYFKNHRLGLVLSVDHPRRLLSLRCRLETLRRHEVRGCHRHGGLGPGGHRSRQGQRQKAPSAPVRQWRFLRLC